MNTRINGSTRARGFSLIELLVVIGILVIVMAIILPVLSGARDAARKASTVTIFADLTTASAQFRTDQRREPGYFSLADMGNLANAGAGFTQMNNILLDLTGGITTGREDISSPADPVVNVGPHKDALVLFDKRLMSIDESAKSPNKSAAGGGYFRPGTALIDWKFFQKVTADPTSANSINEEKYTRGNPANNMVMPDLVDGWGNPILAWGIDTSAAPDYANTTTPGTFGVLNSSVAGPHFVYWAQNAGFLRATKMASRSGGGTNQKQLSLLGVDNAADATTLTANLEALLGNPAYATTTTPTHPTAARGSIVFHSAGSDAVFMSKEDRGGKSAAGGTKAAYLSANNTDAMNAFDDVVQSAGQ